MGAKSAVPVAHFNVDWPEARLDPALSLFTHAIPAALFITFLVSQVISFVDGNGRVVHTSTRRSVQQACRADERLNEIPFWHWTNGTRKSDVNMATSVDRQILMDEGTDR